MGENTNCKLWNKDFILLLQGTGVSSFGDILYSVAIGYWVYEKTGSNALMGIMSSITSFVVMLLSPFSGSIIDKIDRKFVIVGMDIVRGFIMMFAGIMAYSEKLTVSMVLICAFLASIGTVFFNPAVDTTFIDIIPHHDMVRGQSVANGVKSFITLIGKALSGTLVAFFGVGFIIVFNGICYFLSAITEFFISVPKTAQQGEKVTVKSLIHDMKIAITVIFDDRFLKLFVPFVLLVNLLASGPMALKLPFVMNKGLSVDFYGYLMAIETAGSLLGILFLSFFQLKSNVRYLLMSFGYLLSGIFYIIGYLSNSGSIIIVMCFIGSLGNAVGNLIFNASLMLALPDKNRGAIIGFINSCSVGGCAISAVIFGVLCDLFSISYVFAVGTLISLILLVRFCFNQSTREFVQNH